MRGFIRSIVLLILLLSAACANTPVQPSPTPAEPTPAVPPTPSAQAESIPGATAPASPSVGIDGVVATQALQTLPENVAAQLSFLPPEGGAAGTGSIFNCMEAAATEPFTAHVAAVGIGASLTLCYRDISAGPVVERIFDPEGNLLRELAFDLEPEPLLSNIAANDFTPQPGDPLGDYRAELETPDGTFEAHFTVQAFQGLGDAGIDYGRLLKPVGRTPSATPSVGDTAYLLAVGFAPDEVLDLYFYTTCRFTGKRRIDQLGYTYLTGVQGQVNHDGYAFFDLPAALREQVPAEQTYTAFARGNIGVTELPADIMPWSMQGVPVSYAEPASLGVAQSVRFDGGFDPAYIQMGLYLDNALETCPPISEPAPPPADAPAMTVRQRFDLTQLTTYDTVELVAIDGRLYANAAGIAEPQAFSWDLASGEPGAALPVDRQPRRLWYLTDTMGGGGAELSFIADGIRYNADDNGSLMRVDPATGASSELLKAPVNWNTWRINVDNRNRPTRYPSLTVADEVAYFGGEDHAIYAIDTLDSTSVWRSELPSLVSAPPAVSRQTVYVGTYDGTLYALDSANGDIRWSFMIGDWLNTPVVTGDTVYIVAESNTLFALDARTGQERWRVTPEATIFSDPLPVGDLVYIAIGQRSQDNNLRWDIHISAVGTSEQLATLGAAAAATASASAETDPTSMSAQRFRIIDTSDGFVSVRAEPTTASAEVTRLMPGTELVCSWLVAGQAIDGTTQWAFCPEVGGYIFGPLLQPVASAVSAPASAANSSCVDPAGDASLAYVDLRGATITIRGETMTAVLQLAGLPATLAYNKPGVEESSREYMWEVEIFLDGAQTDAAGNKLKSDYTIAAAKWRGGGAYAEEPLEQFVQVDRWKRTAEGDNKWDSLATLQVDYDVGTLTLSAEIPGLTPQASVRVRTFADTGAIVISDELSCRL